MATLRTSRTSDIIKAIVAFGLIIVLVSIAAAFHKTEKRKIALRDSGLILEGDIVNLNCVQGAVTFKVQGKIFTQRIYLTKKECEALAAKNKIRLKVLSSKEFVYADEEYNDWTEAEIISTWMLTLALVMIISYYYIVPLFRN
jgi:hypothetical protein